MRIEKISGMKVVDCFQSTAPQQIDGEWVVVTAYSRKVDDGGRYRHIMDVRQASPDEIKAGSIVSLEGEYRRCGNDASRQIRKEEIREELKKLKDD